MKTTIPGLPCSSSYLQSYEAQFGRVQQYYAIDQQQWPPMALARFEKEDVVYFSQPGRKHTADALEWKFTCTMTVRLQASERMELGLRRQQQGFYLTRRS